MHALSNEVEVGDLVRGAVVLGCGGGGDPFIGELFLADQMRGGKTPTVLQFDALSDDALVVSIAGVGAPPVVLEHLISTRTLLAILESGEALLGRPIDALISAEIGGLNAIMPLALAAISGIPVLDGDGVGRAIPHTQMCAFSIYGAPSTPCVMMDELGNEIILKISDDRTADGLIRSATDALGACAFGAFFPMTGAQTKLCSVRNTLSLCHGIGRSIREAREAPRDVFASLLAFLNVEAGRHARVLFDGKITDVTHEIRGGWHWGQVKIAALRGSEDVFTVDIKNEYLIARRNGVAVAMMPDLIAILDRETGEPITAERLHYGQRVKVLGLSADPMLRTPQALEVMGPRALQIDEDFSPLEAGPLYQVN